MIKDAIFHHEMQEIKLNIKSQNEKEEAKRFKSVARQFRRQELHQKLQSNRNKYDLISTKKNDYICFFALFGFLLQIYLLIIDFDFENRVFINPPICDVIRILISLSTIILAFLIMNFYYVLAIIEDSKWGFPTIWAGFFNTKLALKALTEMIICAIHPIPFMDPKYDAIGLLMILRIFLLMRYLKYHSRIFKQRHRILKDKEYIRRRRPIFGWQLVMKTHFYTYPMTTLVITYSCIIAITAFCVHVAEREANEKLTSYYNAIYMTIISNASIGYGDITPITYLGKFIVCLFALLGYTTLSLVVSVGDRALRMRTVELYSVEYVGYLVLRSKQLNTSASYIQCIWKLRKIMLGNKKNWPYKKEEAGNLSIYQQSLVSILISKIKQASRSMHRYRIRSLALSSFMKDKDKKEEPTQQNNAGTQNVKKEEKQTNEEKTEEQIRQRMFVHLLKNAIKMK